MIRFYFQCNRCGASHLVEGEIKAEPGKIVNVTLPSLPPGWTREKGEDKCPKHS